MKRIFSSTFIIFLSLFAAYHILSIWRGLSLYEGSLSRENLIKATQTLPSNPDPFYRLGLFYQWDIRHIDSNEALGFISKAIEKNPLEQQYWLNLARVYHRMGKKNASEKALQNAVRIFPTGYEGRWVSANLLLEEEALEKALPHFSYILANYPNQSPIVYDVLGKAIDDSDFIIEKLVPREPASIKQYLSYLYETGDKESVKKVWQKRDLFAYKPDRSEALRHIEFLISRGELNEAFQVWKARLREEGLSTSSDGDLITNGGFEEDKILGGGFDWKIEKVSGADITFDSSMPLEGKRSLKIVFNGKENVDFHHLYQFFPLEPNSEYILRAHMKTRAVTTKSGVKLEVSGVTTAFHQASEALIGDNEWKELMVTFRTPAQCQGGLVRIRRQRTDKFDRFISGTVWIDNFRLTEKSH